MKLNYLLIFGVLVTTAAFADDSLFEKKQYGGATIEVPKSIWQITQNKRKRRKPPRLHTGSTPQLPNGPVPNWAVELTESINSIFFTFFKNVSPNPNTIETTDPIEVRIGEFVKQIEGTRFAIVGMGGSKLKLLGVPYFFSELQGGPGVELSFITPEDPQNKVRNILSFRFFPAYGEYVMVRVAAGAKTPEEVLPGRSLFGFAGGLEAALNLEDVAQPGARFYARPLADLGGEKRMGIQIMSALYCRIPLSQIKEVQKKNKIERSTFYLTPMLAYYKRSDAFENLYEWKEPNGVRPVELFDRVWEATLYLELRY